MLGIHSSNLTISYTQITFINTSLPFTLNKNTLKPTLLLSSVLLAFISFAQENLNDTITTKIIAQLKAYPIPADRSLFIEWDNIDNYAVKLYNSFGNRVLAAKPDSSLHKIELQTTHLENGTYIVRVFNKHKLIATKRIVIKH